MKRLILVMTLAIASASAFAQSSGNDRAQGPYDRDSAAASPAG